MNIEITIGSTFTSKSGWSIAEVVFIYPDGSYRTRIHNWKHGGTILKKLSPAQLLHYYPKQTN